MSASAGPTTPDPERGTAAPCSRARGAAALSIRRAQGAARPTKACQGVVPRPSVWPTLSQYTLDVGHAHCVAPDHRRAVGEYPGVRELMSRGGGSALPLWFSRPSTHSGRTSTALTTRTRSRPTGCRHCPYGKSSGTASCPPPSPSYTSVGSCWTRRSASIRPRRRPPRWRGRSAVGTASASRHIQNIAQRRPI